MDNWAAFITDPEVLNILSWLGISLLIMGVTIWLTFKYFVPRESKDTSKNTQQSSVLSHKVRSVARGGSPDAAKDLYVNGATGHQGPSSNLGKIARVTAGVVIVALTLAAPAFLMPTINGSAPSDKHALISPGGNANSSSVILLRDLRASRLFASMKDLIIGEYAGVGVVAFPRSPEGSLVQRATLLCEAFALSMETVQVEIARGFEPEQLVVTVWPVEPKAEDTGTGESGTSNTDTSSKPVEKVPVAGDQKELAPDISCEEAIVRYDWREGSDALQQAAVYYRNRGKPHVAEKIGAPDQDGPWLLAWAPGKNKGSSEDDVLVLAYDLSEVQTQQQAERVFQSWRIAVESNTDLWLAPQIANEHWTSAFVRFLNMLGDNTDFYTWMMKG